MGLLRTGNFYKTVIHETPDCIERLLLTFFHYHLTTINNLNLSTLYGYNKEIESLFG
jgi:hypothetical protein